MPRSTPRLLWRFGAEPLPTPKWRSLPERLLAHRLQLLLQLGVLLAELLVLTLQLRDPPPQLLGFVVGRRWGPTPRPRLAPARRAPNHESAYKHTLAPMESDFFARANAAR